MSVDQISLYDPLDMHVHFRSDTMLEEVAPHTARSFSGALIMPNPEPPITTEERLDAYYKAVCLATKDYNFTPYMTLYFQTTFTREFLEKMRPKILSVKLYPKGITTNSHHGVDVNDLGVERVLGYLEELQIPVNVHGETKGYVMRREENFMSIYDEWARKFKKLKIVMEHITTRHLAQFLYWHENVFATITPHHLLFTTDDVVGDYLNPHHYCKPIAKTPEDLAALRDLVMSGNRDPAHKVMLGTDSAPHPVDKKESACGCAGVFNAPFALQLLAQEFMTHSDLDHLQRFVSSNAEMIYGIRPSTRKRVVLEKKPARIEPSYGDVIPMWAGQQIDWSIKEISKIPNYAKEA